MSDTRANDIVQGRLLGLVRDLISQPEASRPHVYPQHVQTVLRAVLDLLGKPTPSKAAEFETEVRLRLDVEAWLIWAEAGLTLFAFSSPQEESKEKTREEPSLHPSMACRLSTVVTEARRLVVVIAMLRSRGNLTQAAESLGTSRKTVRDQLKAAGLYPWDRVLDHLRQQDDRAPLARLEPPKDKSDNDGA